jgi:hypothetical protein
METINLYQMDTDISFKTEAKISLFQDASKLGNTDRKSYRLSFEVINLL